MITREEGQVHCTVTREEGQVPCAITREEGQVPCTITREEGQVPCTITREEGQPSADVHIALSLTPTSANAKPPRFAFGPPNAGGVGGRAIVGRTGCTDEQLQRSEQYFSLHRVSRKPVSRSLRRALLTPQVNPGSLYRCGKSTLRAACGPCQEEKGA